MRILPYVLGLCFLLAPSLASAKEKLASSRHATRAKVAQRSAKRPRKHRTRRIKDRVGFIRRNLLHVRLGFWGAKITQNGRKYGIGLTSFGSLQELFFEDRIATGHYNAYKAFYATGFAFSLIGLGALLVDIVLMTVNPGLFLTGPNFALTMGLLLGGTVFGVVGPILIGVGQNRLMRAVETYNQGVFSRARHGRWRVSFRILPQGGFTAGAACRF